MCVVDQSCRFDCSVQDSYGLQRSAANPERGSKHGRNQREVVALAGCAVDGHCAIGVPPCRLEVIEIHLGQREMCDGVQVAAELFVREPVDQRSRLVALFLADREAPDIAAPAAWMVSAVAVST